MRKHLLAIETNCQAGRLLTFDQPKDVAGFVRALGAVATNRKKRIKDELGEKGTDDLLEEFMKVAPPSMREALAAMLKGG